MMPTSARRHLVILALCVGPLLGRATTARAQAEFQVIVHPGNPTVSLGKAQLSKLFLRKTTKWATGQPVQPVDQVESSPVRRKFSQAVHQMDVPSVKSYWQELVFSGRGEPPSERADDADIIAYVKANPNAIGYIASTTPATDVKVLTVTP